MKYICYLHYTALKHVFLFFSFNICIKRSQKLGETFQFFKRKESSFIRIRNFLL